MLEPTHRLKELAGWLLPLFSFIWLAGFTLLGRLIAGPRRRTALDGVAEPSRLKR